MGIPNQRVCKKASKRVSDGTHSLTRLIAQSLNQNGQFIPITAMVVFTTVTFLVAVVNVYSVARAKLKVQNLADAVALNVGSQMASSMNKVADLNEWMNHMLGQPGSATASTPGALPNCVGINRDLPPISCAENATTNSNLNMFTDKTNATRYALLVQTVNQAQQMFIDTYNNFIGVGNRSNPSAMSQSSLQSILFADIPELNEAGTVVEVWNDQQNDPTTQSNGTLGPPAATAPSGSLPAGHVISPQMKALDFKPQDFKVTFQNPTRIPLLYNPPAAQNLSYLAGSNTPVGYMVEGNNPKIKIGSASNPNTARVGVGARVSRTVNVPLLGPRTVAATARAFVVQGSGAVHDMVWDQAAGVNRPVFRPTYWVKLVGAQ
jgi:hypothetical protein